MAGLGRAGLCIHEDGGSLLDYYVSSRYDSLIMRRPLDLAGKAFGHWTVLSRSSSTPSGAIRWLCRCKCGTERLIVATELQSGRTRSCGCSRHNIPDLSGKHFGKWTVVKRGDNSSRGQSRWLCKCTCGRTSLVSTYMLTHRQSSSCGRCPRGPSYNAIDLKGQRFGDWEVLRKGDHTSGGKLKWACKCGLCGTVKEVSGTDLRMGKSRNCGCSSNMLQDLVGQRFGDWTVIERAPSQGKFTRWKCRCSCGRERLILASALRLGRSSSCGFDHDLSEEDRLLYREYIRDPTARDLAFKRDGYTCQICGKKGGYLHAHHMNSYKHYKHQRSEVANLVTLCVRHHRLFHHLYGRTRNTKSQYHEFKHQNTQPVRH